MSRRLIFNVIALLCVVLVSLISMLSLARFASSPSWEPLTLPVASASGGLPFYGACVGGDDFVWCVDKSASMGWAGTLEEVKAAIIDSLQQLSPGSQFTIAMFSSNTSVFASTLIQANPTNIAAASDWVGFHIADGSTCMVDALEWSVNVAGYSLGTGVVILVSDDTDSCSSSPMTALSVVNAVAEFNTDNVVIHSFFVDSPNSDPDTLSALADAFGGVFVDTTLPLDYFRRGDASSDGIVDLSDAVFLLAFGFIPGSPAPLCDDAADFDDDGTVDPLVDASFLLQSLFVPSAPALPPPAQCDSDPTADSLTCEGACS